MLRRKKKFLPKHGMDNGSDRSSRLRTLSSSSFSVDKDEPGKI